jgi:hypothetical protein
MKKYKKILIIAAFLFAGLASTHLSSIADNRRVHGDFGNGTWVSCDTKKGDCRWGDSQGIHNYSDVRYGHY